ncbi:unnamed protein product [Calicophoron daubneyi]|uniref:Ubiquitin-like domain-containing protein n=1 Tax=Calicophoron daubneyi TaxID=300641 RepID=A0AAV2TEI8_CALDB
MKVEVRDSKTDKLLHTFTDLPLDATVLHVKQRINVENRKLALNRQALRSTANGKPLNDDRRLEDLRDPDELEKVRLYLRDLGPQIGWRTVFLVEYAGPLIIYFAIWLLRNPKVPNRYWDPMKTHLELRTLALTCWCLHYIKRLLETLFVHRFSHATMPLRNLFKNCAYYFGFAGMVSYFTNHPLYTLPAYGCPQICVGLGIFLLGEWGNFSCHLALRNLRPPGSTVRQIPKPVRGWIMTRLFDLVACPHYTYEVASWFGFAIMTQTLPAALFALMGFSQMSIWALAKLRAYRREFPEFPRARKAIVPFIL